MMIMMMMMMVTIMNPVSLQLISPAQVSRAILHALTAPPSLLPSGSCVRVTVQQGTCVVGGGGGDGHDDDDDDDGCDDGDDDDDDYNHDNGSNCNHHTNSHRSKFTKMTTIMIILIQFTIPISFYAK
jgi:hypothetical protein